MLKKFLMALITILCSLGITIAISYAWFLNDTNVDPIAQGYSGEAYFAYGNGGSGENDRPYGINTPRHLYNLAWLCYLDPVNYANKYYEIDPSLKGSLNMDGWTLPPIGKDNSPFTGFFNGNGKTITNLTISNDTSSTSMPIKPNSIPSAELDENNKLVNATFIGFFGKISGDGTTQVHDFYLDNAKIETKTSSTCAGIVAGYVDGKIENVGVINSGLDLGASSHGALTSYTNNVSDYTVVGYAEDEYTTSAAGRHTIIYNPKTSYTHFNFTGMGDSNTYGGSLDMQKLYNRIRTVANDSQHTTYPYNDSDYNSDELRYVGYEDDSQWDSQFLTSTFKRKGTSHNYNPTLYYRDMGDANGTYLKDYQSADGEKYQTLTALYKTVTVITKTETTKNGYILKSNGKYMTIESNQQSGTFNFNVLLSSDDYDGNVWCEEEYSTGKRIYTYNPFDGYKYYLVANSNLSVSISNVETNGSVWYWENDANEMDACYVLINSEKYYLKFFDGAWTLKNTYVIGDGNGHYLKNNNNAVANANSIEDATPFTFSVEGTYPSGIITANNGAYLINNPVGTLSFGTTNSNNVWSNENGLIYNTRNNLKYYLQYDNAWTLKAPTTYYIEYNGNYLYLNNSGQIQTAGTTDINDATAFTISNALINGTGTGTISATIGNRTYYLRFNNYNTFDTSTSTGTYTTWSNDGHGFYQTNDSTNYYIQYRNNWVMSSTINQSNKIAYYIKYDSSNYPYYLSVYNGEVELDYGQNYPTYWYFTDTSNQNQPQGYLYTYVNGTIKYLNLSSSTSTKSTLSTTPHTFSWPQSKKLYDNDMQRFLYWDDYWSGNSTGDNIALEIQQVNTFDYDTTPLGKYRASNLAELSILSAKTINKEAGTINVYTRDTGLVEPSLFNCIPINVGDDYSVKENNTGYILSGAYETAKYCDIRVSQFQAIKSSVQTINSNAPSGSGYGGDIADSWSGSDWNENTIKTIDNDGLKIIKDGATTPSSSYISSSVFEKYDAAKSQLKTTLINSNGSVYGLHFMNASISKKHIATVSKVKINKKTYSNYQMPEDCIDFNLADKGYINCFSGYYFGNNNKDCNNCFFSLNEIIRDSQKHILEIRHILNVYENKENTNDEIPDGTYVYYYENADDHDIKGYYYLNPEYDEEKNSSVDKYITVTSFTAGNYDKKFDYTWIEKPVIASGYSNTNKDRWRVFYNANRRSVFYFEIPVNPGEYGLGSVSGKDEGTNGKNEYVGTYLIYLDIGANAAIVDRTEISQVTENIVYSYKYVNGIQVLMDNSEVGYTDINPQNSVVSVVNTSDVGVIVLTKTSSDTIYIKDGFLDTSQNRTLDSTYKGDNITTFNGDLSDVPKSTTTTRVLKFIDYNNGHSAMDALYRTTITQVSKTVNGDLAWDTDYKVHRIAQASNDASVAATNLNIYDDTINVVPNSADYGLLRRGTTALDGKDKDGYGIVVTDASTLMTDDKFRSTEADNKILEYSCKIEPNNDNNLKAISESIILTVAAVDDERTINGVHINAGTEKIIEADNYAIKHVYRMTGDTITISSTALDSIINGNVKVLVYVPTLVEKTGDTDHSYVFVINGTNVTAVGQTFAVTSGA